MVDEAKRRGLVLLHENEKHIYGDTPERCLDLMQEFYGEHFQATFDPANFVQCQVNVYPHAYDLLASYIAYMHIKDAHLTDGTVTVAGRGDGGVKEVLSRLSEENFEGFLSLEPHLTDFVGFKDLEQHAVEEVKEDAGMGGKTLRRGCRRIARIIGRDSEGGTLNEKSSFWRHRYRKHGNQP